MFLICTPNPPKIPLKDLIFRNAVDCRPVVLLKWLPSWVFFKDFAIICVIFRYIFNWGNNFFIGTPLGGCFLKLWIILVLFYLQSKYWWIYIVCSEIPSSKNSYLIKISQLICKPNKLAGFYMMGGFAESISEKTISYFWFLLRYNMLRIWELLHFMPSWL